MFLQVQSMRNYKLLSVFSNVFIAATFILSLESFAAVNVDKTRLIFNSSDMDQTINLYNNSSSPAVVQLWTDDQDINVSPDESKTPVIVLPPVLKILPNEKRSLRVILTTRKELTSDRESLYWLNIYQIPSIIKSKDRDMNKIFFPLRLRLKVFVRPAHLGSPSFDDMQKLKFIKRGAELRVVNPTAWYASLNVSIPGFKKISKIMIAPLAEASIQTEREITEDKINYEVIGDSGFSVMHTTKITSLYDSLK